jgi:hypothetical protein
MEQRLAGRSGFRRRRRPRRRIGRLRHRWSLAGFLIRQDGANCLEILLNIVLRRNIQFLNRLSDHDDPAA